MANDHNGTSVNLTLLATEIYEAAKRWLAFSTIIRLAMFVIGYLAVASQNLSVAAPFVLLLLSACAEWCMWQSNEQYSLAETLRRKTDMKDGLGWSISSAELSDVLVRVPRQIVDRLQTTDDVAAYFASDQPVGPSRAMENLQESAWWSKHLAEKAAHVYLWSAIGLIVISLSVLLVSIQTINNFSVLQSIGRAITSTIMLIFSLALLRSTWSYFRFSGRSERIENQASELLKHGNVGEVPAAKLMNEYHLARATAPILPTWIWKYHRNRLNQIWREYRKIG